MRSEISEPTHGISIPFKEITLRGYSVSQDEIFRILSKLDTILKQFGTRELDSFAKPEDKTDEEWAKEKARALDQGFAVTTTVHGFDGKNTYAPRKESVFSANTPARIRSIYCTNRTAYRSLVGQYPTNEFELNFDFSSPPPLDAANALSAPTPNQSTLKIKGLEDSWVSAIEAAVVETLNEHQNHRRFLHRSFVYDFGLAVIALPLGFTLCIAVNRIFSVQIEALDNFLRAAIWLYIFLVAIWFYRFSFGYVKWAFPVMELLGKYNRRRYHRKAIYFLASGLFLSGLAKLIFG